jgi:hypothetical protein
LQGLLKAPQGWDGAFGFDFYASIGAVADVAGKGGVLCRAPRELPEADPLYGSVYAPMSSRVFHVKRFSHGAASLHPSVSRETPAVARPSSIIA